MVPKKVKQTKSHPMWLFCGNTWSSCSMADCHSKCDV